MDTFKDTNLETGEVKDVEVDTTLLTGEPLAPEAGDTAVMEAIKEEVAEHWL